MYDMRNLAKFETMKTLAPEAFKAFVAFDAAAVKAGAIPVKYKELIAVAVALTTQCPYCIEIHKNNAKKAGATEQELAETTLVAAALRAGGAQIVAEPAGAVVDTRIEAELVDDVATFRGASRDADDPAAGELRQLPDDAAHGARGCGDDKRVTELRLRDLRHPEPGGDSGHAENAEITGGGKSRLIDLRELRPARDTVVLPAEHRQHVVAGRIARVV
jgi:AhpD family alkylhydroperoxidase